MSATTGAILAVAGACPEAERHNVAADLDFDTSEPKLTSWPRSSGSQRRGDTVSALPGLTASAIPRIGA